LITSQSFFKELQQKSVVYLNGWLGTIAESERFATVVLSNNDLDDQVPLSNFNNHDAQMIEVPWINERLTIPLRKYQSRQPNPNLNIIPPNNNFRVPIDPNKIHSEPKFLHDLSVSNFMSIKEALVIHSLHNGIACNVNFSDVGGECKSEVALPSGPNVP